MPKPEIELSERERDLLNIMRARGRAIIVAGGINNLAGAIVEPATFDRFFGNGWITLANVTTGPEGNTKTYVVTKRGRETSEKHPPKITLPPPVKSHRPDPSKFGVVKPAPATPGLHQPFAALEKGGR